MDIDGCPFVFSVSGQKVRLSLKDHHGRLVRQPRIFEDRLNSQNFNLAFLQRRMRKGQSRRDYHWTGLGPGRRRRRTGCSFQSGPVGRSVTPQSQRSRGLALIGIHIAKNVVDLVLLKASTLSSGKICTQRRGDNHYSYNEALKM